jgi:hypothetical protein
MGRLETMISGIECPVIFEVAIRCKEYLGKLRGPRTGIVMQDVPEYKIPKGEI